MGVRFEFLGPTADESRDAERPPNPGTSVAEGDVIVVVGDCDFVSFHVDLYFESLEFLFAFNEQ